jgi:mono/diheme cytochrome c family protein
MMTVTPGNLSESKLYEVIKFNTGEDKMPPSGKTQLTTAEIDSIAAWISYGALDQYCGETCDTVNPVTFSGTIWPVMQTSCMGCHSGNSPAGSIPLTNYTQVAVIAGNGSLINSLKGNGVPKMPSGGSFSTCRIRQFEIWVNNGYSNN